MAIKDKNSWLKLFYEHWGYEPYEPLKKKTGYYDTILLEDALTAFLEFRDSCDIRIAFPFKGAQSVVKTVAKKKITCPNYDKIQSVAIFPQVVRRGKRRFYEILNPIIYGDEAMSLDSFIKKADALDIDNATGHFGSYTFSLPFFMLTTGELNQFKKYHLTSLRSVVTQAGLYDEGRGPHKNKDSLRERKKIVIQKAKKLAHQKKYLTMQSLTDDVADALDDEAKIKYPQWETDQRKEYRSLSCGESTVWKILKPLTKNLIKK